jgi:hypothetical protein
MKDSPRCFWCNNWCRVSVSCIPKEHVTLDRYFWEERTAGITIYKNDELIEHYSASLTVGPHLEAPYGFWRHTNNATSKESIFLNTATSNYLEGTNYNYSYTPLNNPGACKQDYVMTEIRTANSMPNIPSCSTLVTLKTTDVIPVTNYCQAIKAIKNTESNSIGIKSLSGSCDIKVKDKLGYQLYISVDEGSYRFFNDLQGISCNLIGEGSYTDCSDKEPEDIKPKDQGFDESAEKIVDTFNSATGSSGLDISFGSLFQSKAKQIALNGYSCSSSNSLIYYYILLLQ